MQTHPRPLLIAMKGHPGAGKSAIARALSRQLGISVIDKDDIKDVLDGRAHDAGGLAYIIMFNIARRQLTQGLSVICDSPLSESQGYAMATAVAHDTASGLVIVECVCSSEGEWRKRIAGRSALRLPDHHVKGWGELEAHLRRRGETSRYPVVVPHLTVDTVAPLEDVVARVIGWLHATTDLAWSRGSPEE
jgi:predicted kinase